jgi:nicotinamide-nucleotide amidase
LIAEIINVGTEILLGDILNTNSRYLSRRLAETGYSVFYQTVVGDNEKRLLDTINLAKSRCDVIILTGGLGPTNDDITKETVAKALNLNMYENIEVLNKIKDFFKRRDIEMTRNNVKQALMPEGSIILENNNGTAPGVMIDKEDKIFIILPGPPNELEPMFENCVIPILKDKSDKIIVSRTLKLVGIGESTASQILEDILNNQTNPTIAPYAKQSEVHFRITAKADNVEVCNELIDGLEAKVRYRLGEYIYTTSDKELKQVIVEKLINNKLTLSIAESCTGGLLSSLIVNCSGASKIFKEGIVTYANEAKINELNVDKHIIDTYGAVSQETARAMAMGLKNKVNTDISIATTGIAGPGGGTEEKPVGLVYIAIAYKKDIYVKKYNFTGNRTKIRNNAAKYALIHLNKIIGV